MSHRILLALVLSLGSVLAAAQTTIYKSQGTDGPVYSDQPSPGAQEMALPPPNVIDVAPVPQQSADTPAAAPRDSYVQFAIVFPENNGAVHSNTGAFELQVQVEPPLQDQLGDAIVVTIDGNPLPQQYSGTTINITSADWAATSAGTAEHTLAATVVDQSGSPLISSAPVTFYMLRATRSNR
jgi:hypothetical protein